MPTTRYPFYDSTFEGDFEDLSYYGGRWSFLYPRSKKDANRLALWNKYAYSDHYHGPTNPDADSYQVTEDPGGLTSEEIASLSDGKGYPKEQPSPVFPLQVAGRLNPSVLGFTYSWEDVGTLNQYPGLPRATIAAGDGDLNPGLRAMLTLFGDTLTLTSTPPRTYWWMFKSEESNSPPSLHQKWGQVDVWEYKWSNPGEVESPIVEQEEGDPSVDVEEDYHLYKMTTPAFWSGNILSPAINDPNVTVQVIPLTHEDGDAQTVTNRFRRWKQSRFWIVAHTSDAPDWTGVAEDDQQRHDTWIEQVGKIFLYDHEVKTVKRRKTETRRWIKKWS